MAAYTPKDPHVIARVKYVQERVKDFRYRSDAVRAIMDEKALSERQVWRDLSVDLNEVEKARDRKNIS